MVRWWGSVPGNPDAFAECRGCGCRYLISDSPRAHYWNYCGGCWFLLMRDNPLAMLVEEIRQHDEQEASGRSD
jgi:hypothetical protein